MKEREVHKSLINRLESPNDLTADSIFKTIEKRIIADPQIIRYFNDTLHSNDYLQDHFQKLYFDGYLSKYDFRIHEFNNQEQPISGDKDYSIDNFRDMVLYSSFKVSSYFYRENESFGFQDYFAILPVMQKDKKLGTIVIELKSKALQASDYFPELLIDGQIKNEDEFKNYSYAFYTDNKLVSQSGSYVYNLVNTTFKAPLKQYVFKTTPVNNPSWHLPFSTYSHLIYKSSDRNMIVVSKQENTAFDEITSLTFFFVILLLFSIAVIIVNCAWLHINILNITDDRIKWSFKINFDKILYKTRIQFSMVFTVVITLILVGIITYVSISAKYQDQQDTMIHDKIIKITAAFENGLFNKYMTNINQESQIKFDNLANSYSADLVLYDRNGALIITTQPRIYEYGLTAKRMNGRAFINLSKLQRSEYPNDETIGDLTYKSAYVPIRNVKGETLAFLQLPYFSK